MNVTPLHGHKYCVYQIKDHVILNKATLIVCSINEESYQQRLIYSCYQNIRKEGKLTENPLLRYRILLIS